jgi:polysaccharide export outer membrane protein
MNEMKFSFICTSLFLLISSLILAQEPGRKRIPIAIEDILRQQAVDSPTDSRIDLNERIRAMSAVARFSQDYLLGSGDIIEVTVFGVEELNKKELVLNAGGKISLPFINEVQLMGLTPREAEVKIAALFEATVMKNPQVSVTVKEYRSQFINVLGAVVKPGTYQLIRRAFLVDALAMAGGLLTEKAEFKALIHRAGPLSSGAGNEGTAGRETLEIDLRQLLENGDASLNVPIYAGDVVSVPERIEHFFYVLGDVNRGGAFEINKGELITFTKALASAGGLLSTAKSSKTIIIRREEAGATKQIPVDATKVLRGQSPDILLSNDDVVFVPGSTTKAVGRGVINSLGNILAAFVYIGVR